MEIFPDTQAVLFDHDDTLFGTIQACWELDKYVARTWYDKDLTDADLRQHWSKPLREMVGIIFETTDVDLALERIMSCYPHYPKQLFAGGVELIQSLQAAGLRTGVVSSTVRQTIEHDWKANTISPTLFDHVQTQEDTSFHKPDARVFEPTKQWLAILNIEDRQVLYIGDGLHDGLAARDAGFQFIGVETGLTTREQFAAAGFASVASIAKITMAN